MQTFACSLLTKIPFFQWPFYSGPVVVVSANKAKLHRKGYFHDLMWMRPEVSDSIRPLLNFCRERIEHSHKLDLRLVASLERDPLLRDRLARLRTVPGVGQITALALALEIGDYTRFPSVKEAISYCGLCSAERSSADKVTRMPISKQRNKHIQRVLVEAAKLAVRQNHELAMVYDKELQRRNDNCATLAAVRKLVAYMLAVNTEPAVRNSRTGSTGCTHLRSSDRWMKYCNSARQFEPGLSQKIGPVQTMPLTPPPQDMDPLTHYFGSYSIELGMAVV